MKQRIPFAAAAAVALLLCCGMTLGRAGQTTRELSKTILRLHIVAASNDEADQSDKLLVRDGIRELVEVDLASCETKEQAEHMISLSLSEIEHRAGEILKAQGRPAPVVASLGPRHFPLRQYGRLTVPAGTYTALTVTIGAGEGKNWWCVMYPPLCYSGAELQNEQEAIDFLGARLTPQTMERVLQGEQTVYRSRLLDGLSEFLSHH